MNYHYEHRALEPTLQSEHYFTHTLESQEAKCASIHSLLPPPAGALHERGWHTMPVSPEVCRRFGWRRMVWSRSIYHGEFSQLLAELCRDDCVHSWAEVLRDRRPTTDPVIAVLEHEATHRPTLFVSYLGVRSDGSSELVGVGSVAERIHRTFPFDGFPVIARCYVRRRFRGAGLYRHLLTQRLALCEALWGARLKAIHLGTANPRVLHAATLATDHERFVQVGEEDLGTGAHQHRVAALLSFSPTFASALCESMQRWVPRRRIKWIDVQLAKQIRRQLRELVSVGLEPGGYATLLALIDELANHTGWNLAERSKAVDELLTLLKAIPLVHEGSST